MEDKRDLFGSRPARLSDVNMLFLSYMTGHEPHEHKFYELEITLLGDGVQVINGASYVMRRGLPFTYIICEPSLKNFPVSVIVLST